MQIKKVCVFFWEKAKDYGSYNNMYTWKNGGIIYVDFDKWSVGCPVFQSTPIKMV